jgi:hypothetical protein
VYNSSIGFLHGEIKMHVPAGKYYLCDPCYVVNDDQWNDYLRSLYSVTDGVFEFKESICVAFVTEYGDGTYEDQHGNMFDVDSGLIGITPIDCAFLNDQPNKYLIIEFLKPTEVSTINGLLVFGEYIIDTSGDDVYDDYDDYDDEYGDE